MKGVKGVKSEGNLVNLNTEDYSETIEKLRNISYFLKIKSKDPQVLSHYFVHDTITWLKGVKLTIEMLEEHWEGHPKQPYFTVHHRDLLIYLVTNTWKITLDLEIRPRLRAAQLLKVVDAIHEINKLTTLQLILLSYKYAYGLRGEHLRKFNDKSKVKFSEDHAIVIFALLDQGKESASDVVEMVTSMSEIDVILESDRYQKLSKNSNKSCVINRKFK